MTSQTPKNVEYSFHAYMCFVSACQTICINLKNIFMIKKISSSWEKINTHFIWQDGFTLSIIFLYCLLNSVKHLPYSLVLCQFITVTIIICLKFYIYVLTHINQKRNNSIQFNNRLPKIHTTYSQNHKGHTHGQRTLLVRHNPASR